MVQFEITKEMLLDNLKPKKKIGVEEMKEQVIQIGPRSFLPTPKN